MVEGFSADDLRRFVRFITGSPNLPHGGLGREGISRDGDGDSYSKIKLSRLPRSQADRLPEAHTCFNTCDLPDYNNLAALREKFQIAMRGSGDSISLA